MVNKIKIMHVVASWMIGGTEKMLMYSIPRYSKERFEMKIVSLVEASYLTKEWEKAGIIVSHLNVAKRKFSWSAFFQLRKAIRDWKPDIVFTYGRRAGLLAKLVKPTIFHRYKNVYGQRHAGKSSKWGDMLLEWCLQGLTDLYICNSKAGADNLKKRVRICEKRVTIIGNGIDFSIPDDAPEKVSDFKDKFAISDCAFVIGTVGRILPIKGHEFLIRAMPDIVSNIPHALLVIVGEDRSDGNMQTLAVELNVSENIRFVGLSNDIAAWHRLMDIFVLPSLSEGMSVATIEAMFSALPVVATNTGGTPELVINEETGILVPPADPHALANAVIRLYNHPELRNALSQAGLERAKNHFTLSQMVKAYETTFEYLIQK